MNTKDEVIAWLQDAYAMEKAMELALEKQIKNERSAPALRERATIHYTETQGHALALEACLHELGTDTSALKTKVAQGMELLKGASLRAAKDEGVKEVLTAYAAEHFEIACYTALIAASKRLKLTRVTAMCEAILKEEEAMGEWLRTNLPKVVTGYLASVAEEEEKR